MTDDVVAAHVVVHGRVQGVFFRDSCREQAEADGVRGWVRNAGDGTVEAWFEGEAGAVDRLVAWCRQGPPSAAVTDIVRQPREASGKAGFTVR